MAKQNPHVGGGGLWLQGWGSFPWKCSHTTPSLPEASPLPLEAEPLPASGIYRGSASAGGEKARGG